MKIREICETINPAVFKRGFEKSIPYKEYLLVAMHGPLPWIPGQKVNEADQFRIEARKNKFVAGWVNFEKIDDEHLEALDLYVNREYRGQGIAKAMYAFARKLGNDIQPSSKQTAMGKLFWKTPK